MNKIVRSRRLLTVIIVGLCGFPVTHVQFAAGGSSTKFTQNEKGLEREFDLFLAACARHNSTATDQAFAVFALPQPEDWFGRYFAKQDINQLIKDNELDFGRNKQFIISTMNMLAEGHRYHAHIERFPSTIKSTLLPRPNAFVPTAVVPVEQYSMKFEADTGIAFSEMGNFVYVEGAYRYIGMGPYPFWSAPPLPHR
jgi:hypothetical protein